MSAWPFSRFARIFGLSRSLNSSCLTGILKMPNCHVQAAATTAAQAAVVFSCGAPMLVCYIDEAGCTGVLPSSDLAVQPVFVLSGLVLPGYTIRQLTKDFLNWKRHFFPQQMSHAATGLDQILVEIKGADDIRHHIRSPRSERALHSAFAKLEGLLNILDRHQAMILAQITVKCPDQAIDSKALYTRSIQNLLSNLQYECVSKGLDAAVVADSRSKAKNENAAHSVFTQMFRQGGDPYSRIMDMPTFGHSGNHAGLQLADLISSGVLYPLCVHQFCSHALPTSPHLAANYDQLRIRFATRLYRLQSMLPERESGERRNGIYVRDLLTQRNSAHLFDVRSFDAPPP